MSETSTTPTPSTPVAIVDKAADLTLVDISHFRRWAVRNGFAITNGTLPRHKVAACNLSEAGTETTLSVEFTWVTRSESGALHTMRRGKRATHINVLSRPYIGIDGDMTDEQMAVIGELRKSLNAQLLGIEPLPTTVSEIRAAERAERKAKRDADKAAKVAAEAAADAEAEEADEEEGAEDGDPEDEGEPKSEAKPAGKRAKRDPEAAARKAVADAYAKAKAAADAKAAAEQPAS